VPLATRRHRCGEPSLEGSADTPALGDLVRESGRATAALTLHTSQLMDPQKQAERARPQQTPKQPENPAPPRHAFDGAETPEAQPNPGDPGVPIPEPKTPMDPSSDPKIPRKDATAEGL
jgi:hypothetical protein